MLFHYCDQKSLYFLLHSCKYKVFWFVEKVEICFKFQADESTKSFFTTKF